MLSKDRSKSPSIALYELSHQNWHQGDRTWNIKRSTLQYPKYYANSNALDDKVCEDSALLYWICQVLDLTSMSNYKIAKTKNLIIGFNSFHLDSKSSTNVRNNKKSSLKKKQEAYDHKRQFVILNLWDTLASLPISFNSISTSTILCLRNFALHTSNKHIHKSHAKQR